MGLYHRYILDFSKCKIVENIVSWRDLHRDRTTERTTGVGSAGRVQLLNSSKCYVCK